MKLKFLPITLIVISPIVVASNMSVNISMQGSINPFTGYRMKYTDKDRKSCTFRFNNPGDGLSYLTADRECPSFVTEKRVFMDAQKALEHMEIVSNARTFSEFIGDDGYGNKVERAAFIYRCASIDEITISNPFEWTGIEQSGPYAYIFMPINDSHIKGWYELDFSGYRIYRKKVGVWRLDKNGTIFAIDQGRSFTIPDAETSNCQYHRAD